VASLRLRLGLVFATILSFAGLAHADNYRRPGLEGKWSRRHLTTPMNSLRMIFGPGQPPLMGDRFAEQNVDGGPQYVRTPSGEDEWWVRGTVGFGLTKEWEAGAVFLPFKVAPDFDFSQITVFVTRGFRFETFDLGLRLSFQTPRFNKDDMRVWILNPGVPFLYRSDFFRFDAALFVPFATRDWSAGVTVPLRATVSLDAHVFLGLETGFAQQRFDDYENDSKVPLGALAGYTALFGSRVVDFTAMFSWDSFWSPNADDASSSVDVKSYRIGAGFVLHSLVR
jgi:hypothetical protein